MGPQLETIRNHFIEGMSSMSQFWGFPRGMGTLFAVLFTHPGALSLDELVTRTGLTKGAVSTNVRALARLGLIHPAPRMADRKDYYAAETDFYKAIRSILAERHNSEFDRAVTTVKEALRELQGLPVSADEAERKFLVERLQAMQAFFDAVDSLTRAVTRLDSLGIHTVQNVLKILK